MAGVSRLRLAWALLALGSASGWAGGDVGTLPAPAGQSPRQAGLHIPTGRPFNSPTRLQDGGGYPWDVYSDLHLGRGANYAYGNGMYLQVSGSNVSGQHWMSQDGREFETGPCSRGNLTVYRRCRIYRKHAMARWLDIFVNNTSAPQRVAARAYSYFNSSISQQLTSSGGQAFGGEDWAFVTDHQQGRPKLLHVVCGPKTKLRPSINTSGNVLYVNYTLVVPPNATSVVCYFESQGQTLEELRQRMKKFRAYKMLRDLPQRVRRLIVNFRIGGELEEIELDRRATGDAVLLHNGDWIVGRITNESFSLETLHGRLELPGSEVIGFVGGDGAGEPVRAVLAGGQAIAGTLQNAVLDLVLPTGGQLRIPVGRIRQWSYRISKAKPEETPMTDPLIVLRNGDRLAFDAAKFNCTLQTRHGPVALSGEHLLQIRLQRPAHGVHQAVFLNGSKLAGLLGPERIALPLKLGRAVDIPRDMIRTVRFAEDSQESPELGRCELTNEDELFGRLADESYELETDFGAVPINPANVLAMAFDPAEPGRVRVTLWNDSNLRGRLRQKTLRFAIVPGPVLNLYVGQIASLRFPHALPPEEVVKLVEKYVAMLSAASYKDRQEAQEKLIEMKSPIIPLLRKYLKDTDPEVRQRIQVILERLGGEGGASPAAPPPGPVMWNGAPVIWK